MGQKEKGGKMNERTIERSGGTGKDLRDRHHHHHERTSSEEKKLGLGMIPLSRDP